MSIKLRLIGAAILVPVTMVMGAKAKKERIAKYQITAIEQPLMDACSSAMSGENVTFTGGASPENGCACLAKTAASRYDGKTLVEYQKFSEMIMEIGRDKLNAKTAKAKAEFETRSTSMLAEQAFSSPLGMDGFLEMASQVTDDVGFCGESKNHRGESMTRIAALRPLGMPVETATVAPEVDRSKPENVLNIVDSPTKTAAKIEPAPKPQAKPSVRMRLRGSVETQSASNND